jgi:RNA polymerase sigma factor (TIGR02999 family)
VGGHILKEAVEDHAIDAGSPDRSVGDVAALWDDFGRGDAKAQARLLSAYYDEFRAIAPRVLRDEGGRLALQPTDLAHEAALRILKLDQINWRDRTHFLALSARVMRQTLLDEVRRFKASKRQPAEVVTQWPLGGGRQALPIDLLDDALERLFKIDADRARVVELRFYAGLTLEEIAHALQVSESTIVRRWRGARAWLLQALAEPA